jgi:chromosome segregation ATPase
MALVEEERVRTLETDMAIIKRDVTQFNILFQKLDITIEKLGDVSNNISKLLAVHEERIDVLQHVDKDIERKLDVKSQEIKDLSTKVDSMNMYLASELSNTETKIKEEIHSIKKLIEDRHEDHDTSLEEISNKVHHIEKWKWAIVGFAIAGGSIADKIPNLLGMLVK